MPAHITCQRYCLAGVTVSALSFLSHMCMFEQLQWNVSGSWCSWELPQIKKMPCGEMWRGDGELPRAPTQGYPIQDGHGVQAVGIWPCVTAVLCCSLSTKTSPWVSASVALGFVFTASAQRDWCLADAECYSATYLTYQLLILCSPGFLSLALI